MRSLVALARLTVLSSILAALLGGCNAKEASTPAPASTAPSAALPDRRSLRPVKLPDGSRMAPSVQKQMSEQYALLTQKIETFGTTDADLGTAYGQMGMLLMAAGYGEAAEASLLNAHALAPIDARWPYYLAHLYRNRDDRSKAAAYFEQALNDQPNDVATLIWLGDVYLDQGRPEAAEPLFSKALSLQPRTVAASDGLGRAALASRQYARAVEHFEQALSVDPRASSLHYPLAMAYRQLGDLGKAEDHLRQWDTGQIRLQDPLMDQLDGLLQSVVAYETRGTKALAEKNWAAAADYFRKGLELAPNKPELRHKLGTALFVMGDARGALEQFETVVRRSPSFAKGHYSLGVLMASRGQFQGAIEELSAATKYDPNYVEAHLGLADALRRSGRVEASLPHYQQIIKLDPRVVEAPIGYTMALARLRRYQEARDRLVELLNVYPDRPEIPIALARILAAAPDDHVRDGRRAMMLLQELLAKTQSFELGETLAMTFAELGQYDEAVRWQRNTMAAATQSGRPDLAPRLAENLRLYERHQPCRTPWSESD